MKKISNLVAAEMDSLMSSPSFGFGKFAAKKAKKVKASCCSECGADCDCGQGCKCRKAGTKCSNDCSSCNDMKSKSANEMFNMILEASEELDAQGFDKAASLLLIASNKLLKEAEESVELTDEILSEMDSFNADDLEDFFRSLQKNPSKSAPAKESAEASLSMIEPESPSYWKDRYEKDPSLRGFMVSLDDFAADDEDKDDEEELKESEEAVEETQEDNGEDFSDEEDMSREELLVLLKDCKEQLDEILEDEEGFDEEEVMELLDCMHEIESLLEESSEDEELEELKEEDAEMDEEMDEFEEMDEEEDGEEDEDLKDMHHALDALDTGFAWEDEV
jgi:hypothetical protein